MPKEIRRRSFRRSGGVSEKPPRARKCSRVGALIGIAVTFGLSRIVRAGGGAGSIYDPTLLAFVVPVLLLLAVGTLASWIPSRRALKINPAIVLRATT